MIFRLSRMKFRTRLIALALLVLHACVATDAAWVLAQALSPAETPPPPPCAVVPQSCCCPQEMQRAHRCCCSKEPPPMDPAADGLRAARCSGPAADAAAGPVHLPVQSPPASLAVIDPGAPFVPAPPIACSLPSVPSDRPEKVPIVAA